MGGYVSFGSFF